ncbi:MAG: hypothetical protein M1540_03150 [Candidatus Bathyarchaeota archaeon]|nr:hypothetical protein [Candidatus Bathyarchaeota archaeon]
MGSKAVNLCPVTTVFVVERFAAFLVQNSFVLVLGSAVLGAIGCMIQHQARYSDYQNEQAA